MTKQIEIAIAKRFIRDVLARGYVITVNDGEEDVVDLSTNAETIFAAMRSSDEDYLRVFRLAPQAGQIRVGWVRFIWGNGVDLISDYSDNTLTNELVKGALRLAERLERDEVPFDQASLDGDA